MRSLHIGVTASRSGLNELQTLFFVRFLEWVKLTGQFDPVLHQGDCIGGDIECSRIFDHIFPDSEIVVHPPEKDELRAFTKREGAGKLTWGVPKSYFARNRDIVNSSSVLCGFPVHNNSSGMGGTWYTLNFARKSWNYKNGRMVVYKIFDENDWDKKFDSISNPEYLAKKRWRLPLTELNAVAY